MDLPAEVTVIDLRAEALRQLEPLAHPNVIALTLEQIEDAQHGMTPQHGPLLVVCERGNRSALAAHYLRADGLDARHWEGKRR
ncbi:rhodanese-like domain-containing protein [Deinococcus sp.]|uniref:rhodanese-like domain-containing protein n=1 Tax=Deinococcus sp. TaxID=47478 RepID=UPI0025C3343B|nr:rhodanese-like domain-containing protein [Deinococcus sp.]